MGSLAAMRLLGKVVIRGLDKGLVRRMNGGCLAHRHQGAFQIMPESNRVQDTICNIQKLEMIEVGLQGCKDMAMNCKYAMHELQICFMSKKLSDLGSVHHGIMQM